MAGDSHDLLGRVLAAGPPLELGGWALEPAALAFVLELAAAGRERIVECGSGASTIALARLLRERSGGQVWALEHDPAFAALVRARLEAEGLAEKATVIEASLEPHPVARAACGWYATAALKRLPPAGVDLLLVDGPPAPADAPEDERSRYPALPLLAGRLGPGAIVVLDDADRAGERWTLARWREDLPAGLDDVVTIHPFALSDRPGVARISLREDFRAGATSGNAALVIDDGLDARYRTIEVRLRCLDDVASSFPGPVAVVKIDVEGHEDHVLRGGRRTIAADRPIIVAEWNPAYHHRRGTDATERLDAPMAGLG